MDEDEISVEVSLRRCLECNCVVIKLLTHLAYAQYKEGFYCPNCNGTWIYWMSHWMLIEG